MEKKTDWSKLFISVLLPTIVGMIAGSITKESTSIYSDFVKPSFAPNSGVFPLVWGILYVLMGLAAYRIWMKQGDLKLYYFQLLLNFLWPILFFKYEKVFLAFILLIILLLTVVTLTFQFEKTDKIAPLLIIPYILWLIFAGVLNYSIFLMNYI